MEHLIRYKSSVIKNIITDLAQYKKWRSRYRNLEIGCQQLSKIDENGIGSEFHLKIVKKLKETDAIIKMLELRLHKKQSEFAKYKHSKKIGNFPKFQYST